MEAFHLYGDIRAPCLEQRLDLRASLPSVPCRKMVAARKKKPTPFLLLTSTWISEFVGYSVLFLFLFWIFFGAFGFFWFCGIFFCAFFFFCGRFWARWGARGLGGLGFAHAGIGKSLRGLAAGLRSDGVRMFFFNLGHFGSYPRAEFVSYSHLRSGRKKPQTSLPLEWQPIPTSC